MLVSCSSEKTSLPRIHHSLRPATQPQTTENIGHVVFHGPLADHQGISHLPVGRSCRNQTQHLYFPVRQARCIECIWRRHTLLHLASLAFLSCIRPAERIEHPFNDCRVELVDSLRDCMDCPG